METQFLNDSGTLSTPEKQMLETLITVTTETLVKNTYDPEKRISFGMSVGMSVIHNCVMNTFRPFLEGGHLNVPEFNDEIESIKTQMRRNIDELLDPEFILRNLKSEIDKRG